MPASTGARSPDRRRRRSSSSPENKKAGRETGFFVDAMTDAGAGVQDPEAGASGAGAASVGLGVSAGDVAEEGVVAAGAGAACSFLPHAVRAMANKMETKSERFIVSRSLMLSFIGARQAAAHRWRRKPGADCNRIFQAAMPPKMPSRGCQSPIVVAETAGDDASQISSKRSMNVWVPIGSSSASRPRISSK